MKKKKIGFLIINFLIVCGMGLNAQNLYIRETGGTQTSYSLSDIKKICFQPRIIEVDKTDGIMETYNMEAIRYLNFIDLTNTGPTLSETPQYPDVYFFPNPVKSSVTIQLPYTGEGHVTVTIYNAGGNVVFQEHFYDSSEIRADLSFLTNGIYFCRVISREEISVIKLVKN